MRIVAFIYTNTAQLLGLLANYTSYGWRRSGRHILMATCYTSPSLQSVKVWTSSGERVLSKYISLFVFPTKPYLCLLLLLSLSLALYILKVHKKIQGSWNSFPIPLKSISMVIWSWYIVSIFLEFIIFYFWHFATYLFLNLVKMMELKVV